MINFTPFHNFSIGPLRIYVWGLLLAIAFLVGGFLAAKRAKGHGLDSEKVYNSLIYIIISSIIGARLSYVAAYPYQFSNLIEIFKIWGGGLTFLGGFLGGLIGFIIYAKISKIDFWKYADLLAPSLALGIAITRIGCFIDWHCYGIPTNLPWGVRVGTALPVHPTQLYHMLSDLILFFILINKNLYKKMFDGKIFALFLILYSIFRFFIDFLRAYEYKVILPISQWTMILVFLIGLGIYFKQSKSLNKQEREKEAE